MAHKKGMGSTRNGRESHSQRLGVKIYGGQVAKAGNIIIRQRGTKYHPGDNVGLGKDHTIFATIDGIVMFRRRKDNRNYVSVVSHEAYQALVGGIVPAAPKAPVKEKSTPATPKAKAAVETTKTPKAAKAPKDAKTPKAANAPKAEKPAAEKPAAKKPSDADDLKKISGVGPAFEKKLNAAGLHTYKQIAEMTEEEMDALAEKVQGISKEKLISEDWKGQAKQLMKG